MCFCRAILLLTIVIFLGSTWGGPAAPLTSVAEVESACKDSTSNGRTFSVTGEVINLNFTSNGRFYVNLSVGETRAPFIRLDETADQAALCRNLELGDQIHLQGILFTVTNSSNTGTWAGFQRLRILSHPGLDTLPAIPPHELSAPKWLNRVGFLEGRIRDAARDDANPDYIHMTIRHDGESAQLMVQHSAVEPFEPTRYLGARVRVFGFCSDNLFGSRKHIGRILLVCGLEYVKIIKAPETPEGSPDIEYLSTSLPEEIDEQGMHHADGTVIATWGESQVLLKTAQGRIIRVCLQNSVLPICGSRIRAVGLPETDFFNLRLLHGSWQRSNLPPEPPPPAVDISPALLVPTVGGHQRLVVRHHGQAIRLTGTVRHVPVVPTAFDRLQLDVDGTLVSIDTSAVPSALADITVGCRMSAAGTCVMNVDNWRMDSTAQQAMGFFLAVRQPADIVILSRPSWWTTDRLLALLGIFAAALLGTIGWNVSLNRRAKAKGRELAAEQLAHVTSELKVDERTRLAVELHDALSQTLTGVSMQIDTAAGFVSGKTPALVNCLALASRTIDACRMELRNTLWDLRSAALDEPDINTAIHKTLCQNLVGTDISVRFNVAREAFSDNTAHAVLKIVRELATNAIRHGKATTLRIAGAIEDDKLLFSVKDNGCGFDPDLAPGISKGHFGLQGIAERLERLNGEMKIDSTPGKGAKVTVILPIPHSGE